MANDTNKGWFKINMFVEKPWPMNFLMTYNAALSACGPTGDPDGFITIPVPSGSSSEYNPPRDIEPTIIYMLACSSRKHVMNFILGYYKDHISVAELSEIYQCTPANVAGVIRYWFETHLSKSNRKMLTYGVSHLIYTTDRESYDHGYKRGYDNGYYLGYAACEQEAKERKNKKDNPKAKSPLSTTIEDLNLSIRTYNCVKRAGIETLDELVVKTKADIKKIRNLGKKSFDELVFKLKVLGYELPDGDEEENHG